MWGSAAVISAPAVVSFAAAAATSGNGVDLTAILGTTLTPAMVIGLLLFGKLRTEPEVKRLETDNAELRAQMHEKDLQMLTLQAGLVDRAIPALTRSTLVLESLAPLLQTETTLRRPRRGGDDK